MDELILGETEHTLTETDVEQIQQLTTTIVCQADRKIDILTRDFDPLTYDNDEMFEAFESFVLQNHRCHVRVILHDPQLAASRGHCLIDLGKKLSSFFSFRCLPERFKSYADTFLIADNIGVIHKPYPDSLKTNFHFSDAQLAKSLGNTFTQMWEEAEPHPYLSSIMI
ncbi:hypothetical protein [Candidatus Albibeggiatoa sp. nov. NOAA]|uniref:DUF7931 domain-containing protein n=1 Tax=Candidatus Albibeggiatoa sp. nov. NOAA TaxID=3162724 RepID=UPI0032F484DC|nr:hypothetical protein [Thiotrichaceae bacterium]